MKIFCVVTFFVLIWVFALKIHGCSSDRARAAIYEEVWESSPELKRVHDNLLTELSYLRKERAKLISLRELFQHEAAIADADRRIRQVEGLMERVQTNLDDVAISVERLALASTSTATSSDLQKEAIESLEASAEEIVQDSEVLRAALESGEFPPDEAEDSESDKETKPGEPELAAGGGMAARTASASDDAATQPAEGAPPSDVVESDAEVGSAAESVVKEEPKIEASPEPAPVSPRRHLEERPRVWTDARGNRVTALFLGIKGLDGEWVDLESESSMAKFRKNISVGQLYSVHLRMPNGRVQAVSMRNLGDADRTLVLDYYTYNSPHSLVD